MLLGSITSFIEAHSQWALLIMFGLLLLESFGLPVPGETALIACSVLASQGALPIVCARWLSWLCRVRVSLPYSFSTTRRSIRRTIR